MATKVHDFEECLKISELPKQWLAYLRAIEHWWPGVQSWERVTDLDRQRRGNDIILILDGGYRDNICTPYGWVTWWRIGSGEGGDYGQPEVRLTYGFDPNQGWSAELPRLHSGDQGLQLFTMWRPHDAGVYALVSIPPGATVRVMGWAQTWSCNDDDRPGYTCVPEWDQVQVAVCLGDTPNPLDATCSNWQTAPDRWTRVGPVEHTVSESGVAVVFLRSWAKWAFEHLDVYWDDVILVVE